MDFKTVHYQPAGRTTVCGFKRHVIAESEQGTCDQFDVLKIPTTTDVRRVTCDRCLLWLKTEITAQDKRIRLGNLANHMGTS